MNMYYRLKFVQIMAYSYSKDSQITCGNLLKSFQHVLQQMMVCFKNTMQES